MDKKLKTHAEALPSGPDQLLALFKTAIQLAGVIEIRVTPEDGFVVQRNCAEDEAVWPLEAGPVVDADFILNKLELDEVPFRAEAHPLQNIAAAVRMVTDRDLLPTFFLAPEGGWVAAYMDLPEDPPPAHVLGMKVATFIGDTYQEKFVVVGGPTSYLADACYGVIIDMGI